MKYFILLLSVVLFTGFVLVNPALSQPPARIDFYYSLMQLRPKLYQVMVPRRSLSIPITYYQFPGFYSDRPIGGVLRVICFPKDTASWNKTWRRLLSDKSGKIMGGHNELTFPYINSILTDKKTQNQFDIYALFVEEKNTTWESDLQLQVKMPNFSRPILIYKKTDKNWIFVEKRTFYDWSYYVEFIPKERKDLF